MRLHKVLLRVWRHKVRVKSDYAREHAQIIAMAASLQLITTKTGANTFASEWLITPPGLVLLNEREHD